MKITNCRLNHLERPFGYDLAETVFSWQVEESAGTRQTAARITVSCGEEVLADTGWGDADSLGTALSFPLRLRTGYTWTVAVRSDAGEEAASEPQTFETAKMDEPWQARWIGCDDAEPRHPVFFRRVEPAAEVACARLYICGLGLYEVFWNGVRAGGEMFAPGCTNYDAWVQYQTFDLTEQLRSPGTLSVQLGNGWYKGRFGYDNPGGGSCYGNSWKLIAERISSFVKEAPSGAAIHLSSTSLKRR